MKPTIAMLLNAFKISTVDAEARRNEFRRIKNLEPSQSNYPLEEVRKVFPGAQYMDVVSTEGLYGMIDDYLFIMFRGTDSLWEWILNFVFCKKTVPYGDTGTNPKIKVHRGFLSGYMDIRELIHTIVKSRKPRKVFVFGHSRGATTATFCALDIQFNFPDIDVGLATGGSPRPGNMAFRASIERRLPDIVRFDYGSDLVPQLPPASFGFEHVGHFCHLGPARKPGIGNMADHNGFRYLSGLEAGMEALFLCQGQVS